MIRKSKPLRVVSLFSGVGGFERGLEGAGCNTVLMCESDPIARAVLAHRFPDVEIAEDITTLSSLPDCDVVTAGWPCQDISLAGGMKGLGGDRSGLISEVFRLISATKHKPEYVLLENVAFALDLHKGESVRYVTSQLEQLGYRWAYRVLDTRSFGLPQRRRRLFVLASLNYKPEAILLDGIQNEALPGSKEPKMVGFYWTEGNRGLGWSPEAIPPLKGGSGLSIPSPPAIWNRHTSVFFSPGIKDAERLQGFEPDWTEAADGFPKGIRKRWLLVGNAVSVPVVEWIGRRIGKESPYAVDNWATVPHTDRLPRAAYGGPEFQTIGLAVSSEGPASPSALNLSDFDLSDFKPVSKRAIAGFTSRFEVAPLRKNQEFLQDLRRYLALPQAA
ncbi:MULTISPECIES: DNA cytosine methyltransferase [unclassified Mesorhizobium]|uniref:DNA cytosine methyltransferase n=1 Tax=Mesorhizobium sp. CO1-1-9 TaxID=2876630 RepID=UPI00112731A5|nr:DNA (cytosine-5-)-methyltransferase [Mesorhizobium sp. CO1-1-9]TPK13492.1 DNA (cytosine-5-)-methyltransferase [Mesorhizobium sp. B2-5-7]